MNIKNIDCMNVDCKQGNVNSRRSLKYMQCINMCDYNIPMLLRYVAKIETILQVQGFLMSHKLHK